MKLGSVEEYLYVRIMSKARELLRDRGKRVEREKQREVKREKSKEEGRGKRREEKSEIA